MTLSIVDQVYCYWKRDIAEWKATLPSCRMEHDRLSGENSEISNEISEDAVRFEAARRESDCNTLALYQQSKSLATRHGIDGLQKLESLMHEVLSQVNTEFGERGQ